MARSKKLCSNKCFITGESRGDVHHLYSRNLMVNRIIEELSLPDNFDINKCDNNTKANIVKKYREIENEHGPGIYLSENIHIKFHSIYGFGNNTKEQFIQFISDFYPEKLDIVKEYIIKNNIK